MRISVIVPSLTGEIPQTIPRDDQIEVIVVKGMSPVSVARNEGLRLASSDYVAWIDADDRLEDEWLPTVLSAIEDSPDVVSFNARVEWVDEKRKSYVIGGEANAADVMAERSTGQLWNKIIRRELFDGLEFKGVVHEDYRLLCELLPRAKRIKHIDKVLYCYMRRACGLSQHLNIVEEIYALKELIKMCDALPDKWQCEMVKGVLQRAADFCRNKRSVPELRQYIRKNLNYVLCDGGLSWRVKVKVLLSAVGV